MKNMECIKKESVLHLSPFLFPIFWNVGEVVSYFGMIRMVLVERENNKVAWTFVLSNFAQLSHPPH